MARRVDEIELVGLAVICLIEHANGLRFDGDATLALDIHRVEYLLDHVTRRNRVRHLEDAVSDGRLAVVDMRDDREVSDMRAVHGAYSNAGTST